MRIDAGGDNVAAYFFAGFQCYAAGAAVFVEDFCHGSVGADFDAQLTRGRADGIGNGAGATAAEAPGTKRAIDFPHVVVQKNVRGARRTDTEESADDAG